MTNILDGDQYRTSPLVHMSYIFYSFELHMKNLQDLRLK